MAPDKISEESSDSSSESSIDLEMDSCCSPARPREDHRDLSLTSSPSSSPSSYTHDQDYEQQVISLVNNNLMNARYHSISTGNTVVHDKNQTTFSSQCPCPSSNPSASVSNSNSCSSTTVTPEPDFTQSVVANANECSIRESQEKISIFSNVNTNSFPKTIVNLSSIKPESVPRTVPCIVLSPPVLFSPTMYTSVSSPNPGPNIPLPLQLTKKQSFATRDLIDDKKDICVNKIDANTKKSDVSKKPLTFGIDRILSEEKTTKERKDVISYSLPLAEDELSRSHRQHQHQHGNYLNLSQCSECFYLSRYCRSVQFPVATPAAAASASYSWVTTPSGYESTLMSPTGYPHQHTSISASYNMTGNNNFTAMPSMVSCNTTGGGRRKRSWSRAVFSNLQRKGLEKRFQIQKYITKPDRRQLAATLGLTDAQVKVWFQNRRMKWRHSKEGKNCGGVGEDVMTSSSANATAPSLALYSSDKK